MILVSTVLTVTGATHVIADGGAQLVAGISPVMLIVVLMVTVGLISNVCREQGCGGVGDVFDSPGA